jgi:hypothetical protein
MWQTLKQARPQDPDLPQRAFDITCLNSILDGTQYDLLPHSFHTEKNDAQEYVPLRKRRPSVRYALCSAVVDDSVGLLFSEEHFPAATCETPEVAESLAAIVKDTNFNEIMIDAATRGSVGSVAVMMQVLKHRLFFKVMQTAFLTPTWQRDAPDTLELVTEKYKTSGAAVRAMGYSVKNEDLQSKFWFQRTWDTNSENWFEPWPVINDNPDDWVPVRDDKNSITHSLGFVPIVWIKNLPGGDDIDGKCTFKLAIDTSIEIDYLLSQGGRALKYACDPTLIIKEPASGGGGSMLKGGGTAIVVDKDGDAKLLEMTGDSTNALLEFARVARQFALESIHGNKADADKIAAAQSGRAMELMNQALIWLADKLRISYGQKGLRALLKMIVQASNKTSLVDSDGNAIKPIPTGKTIGLQWPAWYAPTWSDKVNESTYLVSLTGAGLVSKETATRSIAPQFDIETEQVGKELARIKKDAAEAQAAQVALAAAKPVPDNSGD